MIVKFHLAKLRGNLAEDYLAELCARGRVEGNLLRIEADVVREVRAKYQPSPPSPEVRGLGDAVAMVAKPIARALDHFFGTKLADCQGCFERQKTLNQVMPFNPPTKP